MRILLDRVASYKAANAAEKKERKFNDANILVQSQLKFLESVQIIVKYKDLRSRQQAVENRRQQICILESSRREEVTELWKQRIQKLNAPVTQPTSDEEGLKRLAIWSVIVATLNAFSLLAETLEVSRANEQRSSTEYATSIYIYI